MSMSGTPLVWALVARRGSGAVARTSAACGYGAGPQDSFSLHDRPLATQPASESRESAGSEARRAARLPGGSRTDGEAGLDGDVGCSDPPPRWADWGHVSPASTTRVARYAPGVAYACVVSKVLEPAVGGSAPLQTSVRLEAVAEPSPKFTRMMQHASALETSMTKRTSWPALGDAGSIRTRALTPFLSDCHEVAGGTFGVVGMVRIGGRVDGTADVVTAFAVVGDEGRRVVVVAGMMDDGKVVVAPTTAVVLVVVSSGTVGWTTTVPLAGWPEASEVEGGESTTVAESAPAESSRAMLATRIRTAGVPPADPINAVSAAPPYLSTSRKVLRRQQVAVDAALRDPWTVLSSRSARIVVTDLDGLSPLALVSYAQLLPLATSHSR
jgi:hypothetical protein